MLFRHSLPTPARFLKFNVYTSTTRAFKTNGARANDSSHLHGPETASTPPDAATAERKPDEIPLFAHVGKAEVQSMDNLRITSRQSGRALIHEESLRWKLKKGHDAAIERATNFIIHNDPKSFGESTRVLLLQDNVLRALALSTLEKVLSFFETQAYWISAVALGRIVRRLVSPKQMQDNTTLLSLIQPYIIQHLRSVPSANTQSVSYVPPPIITTTFIYIHALLRVNQEEAISIFRILVDTDFIPSAAMVDSSSTQPLEQIIDMSLVKAGLYWNCQEVSETILVHALNSPANVDPFIIQNAIDCLYTLLSSPSESNLGSCLNIMCFLHSHAPIPDSLVRQFYECATDLDAMPTAEEFYSFSRDPRADLYHRYPPPQGRALSKLMEYSAARSRNIHLVRTLASEAVENRLSIPLNNRARLINIVARKGIASSARALWELYALGKDGSVVYGDSGLMVQMVNLFTNLADRLLSQEEGDSEVNDSDGQQSVVTSDDVRSFVHHIISKFKEYHEPWKDADHRAITSFARACFVVGKYTEGFDAFQVLLDRLEKPDLHDVNVALSALAKKSPKAAARAIKKMEMRGLQPDSVTFGTVLHYASVHNCQEVVSEMIDRVMRTDILKSDVKVFGALIRALAQPEPDDSRESRILKLQGVWKLIHRAQNPQLPTQIGNYLVSLALEAGDATLAFKFWNVVLKDRAEWCDPQQRLQRGAIISLAKEQNQREEISGGYLSTLRRELNHY